MAVKGALCETLPSDRRPADQTQTESDEQEAKLCRVSVNRTSPPPPPARGDQQVRGCLQRLRHCLGLTAAAADVDADRTN